MMAPRGKKTGPTEKEKDAAKDVQETEDPLQAVVSELLALQSSSCLFCAGPRRLLRNEIHSVYTREAPSAYASTSPYQTTR